MSSCPVPRAPIGRPAPGRPCPLGGWLIASLGLLPAWAPAAPPVAPAGAPVWLADAGSTAPARLPAPASHHSPWQPWQAEAPVPPTLHRPALPTRSPAAASAVPWSQANATVGRIGGWQAYAREAQGLPALPPAQVPRAERPGDAASAAPAPGG